MTRYLLLAICTLILFGCEQKNPEPQQVQKSPAQKLNPLPEVTQKPATLLKYPTEAVLVESAAEAIPIWRKFASAKPTLVLLSQNPSLIPIPKQVKENALQLTRNGSLEDFRAKTTAFVADPVILPDMALSAALDAGFFSKIVWVLPTAEEETALSLEVFGKQLVESGSATQVEADSFISSGKGFAGTLRQIPVSVVPYHALGKLTGPAVLHLDQSFSKALYKSEIKTPIHPLTYQLLAKLRATELSTYAATFSQSHQSGGISLEVRFLGKLIAGILAKPERLDQPPAKHDQQHQQALYLPNFFQKEKVLELYLAMEEAAPQDAAVKYALYLAARQFNQGDKALDYLAQAVALDAAYALEYLDLAPMALEKGRPAEALRMLKLAQSQFPSNPFVQLRIADLLAETGQGEVAIIEFKQLLQLPWSDLYFNGIKDALRARIETAQNPPKEESTEAVKSQAKPDETALSPASARIKT